MFNSLRPANIDGTKTTRSTRAAAVAAAALALGMAALPLATAPAASAAASATLGPCTVTAERPYFTGHTVSGKKLIAYPISAKCIRGGVDVLMQQIILEDDPDVWPNENDVQKGWYKPLGTPLRFWSPGTKKVTPVPVYRLTSTWDDLGGAEEVFHRVKFSVRSISTGLTEGPKTVSSANRSIHP